jgi:glutamate N-acetyltransferase/amino-acid N-acetyltransferase
MPAPDRPGGAAAWQALAMYPGAVELPRGFTCHVANIGIKDDTDDFVVLAAERSCPAAAVFTRSRFAGPSVTLSRRHVGDGRLRAFAVISKNANVANGPAGDADAVELAEGVARALDAHSADVLIASTGVIGRRYPMARVRDHLASLASPFAGRDAAAAARAIMTTDTVPKVAEAVIGAGSARVVGIAKGVGMIEPDMATLITLFVTDADLDAATLDTTFRRVVDRTFNALSIDTDTSTSDTAAIMASGAAGPVDAADFERALDSVALSLTRQIARDGEGATTLIEVTVDRARDGAQAKRVAKAIVNSPLVKTAVHGADPNWGRVAMAIGKCSDDTDIDQGLVTIRFGAQEVYPEPVDEAGLDALAAYMKGDEVRIHVSLATGHSAFTVYGCDLSDQYVRINADYTT